MADALPPPAPSNNPQQQQASPSPSVQSPGGPTGKPGRRLSLAVQRELANRHRELAQTAKRDGIGQFAKTDRGPDAVRTNLAPLQAAVNVRGLEAIDPATPTAQALLGWRRELLNDLGGEAHVSAAERALVELATRTKLFIDHVDAYLLEQPRLVTKKGNLKPLVERRQRLVDSLARLLGQLGLERRPKTVTDLAAYVAEKYGAGTTADTPAPVARTPLAPKRAVVEGGTPPSPPPENGGGRP